MVLLLLLRLAIELLILHRRVLRWVEALCPAHRRLPHLLLGLRRGEGLLPRLVVLGRRRQRRHVVVLLLLTTIRFKRVLVGLPPIRYDVGHGHLAQHRLAHVHVAFGR